MSVSADYEPAQRDLRMLDFVIRDDETDEFIGFAPDAPPDIQEWWAEYLARANDPIRT